MTSVTYTAVLNARRETAEQRVMTPGPQPAGELVGPSVPGRHYGDW
ncbi:hypothetical protein [Streptomyces sp. NBC_01618]|nr:hypothetical protein OH735_31125 [Streptomyces sp. NBC_01618]